MPSSAELLELAAQYHANGNIDLAEQYARSVLEETPNHAGALHLLGRIAQQKGEARNALDLLNLALTFDGSNAAIWQHAGDLLLGGGDVRGAITYYEQVVRLRPDFAEGHHSLGRALTRAGRWKQAEECFQQARRLDRTFVPALNNLGLILNQQERWAEAAAVFEEALQLQPSAPEIIHNLATARVQLGDWQEATACFLRALSHRPGNAAEVCIALGSALRRQGRWDQASASYQQALRARPGHGMALYQLSELVTQGHYVFPARDLARLKELLLAGRLREEERLLYAFALANVLDYQGAFDEAFRYYREANDLLRRLFKSQDASFDARGHRAQVDRIVTEQGSSYFAQVKQWAQPAELPVFLVGLPYAGTALVEAMLMAHGRVTRVGEAGGVSRFLASSAADSKTEPAPAPLLPDLAATQAAAAGYLQHLAQLGRGAARVLVSSLDNPLDLGLIATLFSGARVIHCRREPLDVALECYFHHRRDLAFACSLEDMGSYCRAHDRLMTHWEQVLPLTIHEINFEALLQDREPTARALIEFCGLDWDARCAAALAESARPSGHWRHYRAHLGPLLKTLDSGGG